MAQVGPQTNPPPYSQPVTQQPAQTVIIPVATVPQQKPLRGWSTGLCGCCEDPLMCVAVMCCNLCYSCWLASKAGEMCCIPFCVPGWMIALRAHLRGKHGIQGSVCEDCFMVECCNCCVMCQMSREIDNIQLGRAPA